MDTKIITPSHKTFTIHCASHMHYESTDYTEIPTDMNIILYHFPLMNVIPHRQNIYLLLIRDHKPKSNEEKESYTVKQVSKVLHRKFSFVTVLMQTLLSQLNSADILIPYLLTIHFNIIISSTTTYSNVPLQVPLQLNY
jgi:hypothetical protein